MITLIYDETRTFRVWNKNQIWLGEINDNGGRIVVNKNDMVVDLVNNLIYKVTEVATTSVPPEFPTYIPSLEIVALSQQQLEFLSHENLIGLLGGEINNHYHMTQDQHSKLGDHEQLNNLLGGILNEHFHLTNQEHTQVQTLITNLGTGDFVFARGFWNSNIVYLDADASKVPDFVVSRDYELVYASPRS